MSLHPVLDLLRRRAAAGSLPGQRTDGARLALVLEGGGMRGVVSSAMTQALEEGGLTDCFDLVVGCSAGALNGAALLSDVAGPCTEEYAGAFATRRFINPLKLLVGRPAVDVEWVLDNAHGQLDPGRHARTAASPIALHCIATDVETAEGHDLTDLRTLPELRSALLATSRLPWVGGHPVAFRGRRYLDGGLVEAVPLGTALKLGATHALVLLTRPEGLRYPTSEGFSEKLVERKLRPLNPRLVERYRNRGKVYDDGVDDVARREQSGEAPYVLAVRPPADAPVVSRLEQKAAVLRAAAEASLRQTLEQVVRPAREGLPPPAAGAVSTRWALWLDTAKSPEERGAREQLGAVAREVAEAARDRGETYGQALHVLRIRSPGFQPTEYELALGEGFKGTR